MKGSQWRPGLEVNRMLKVRGESMARCVAYLEKAATLTM